MKLTKISIMMIAVVAIGIFALPSTLSIGTGQHKFKQAGTSETSLDAFCDQCHATGGDAINNELITSDTRINDLGYGLGVIHNSQGCNSCHAIAESYGTQKVTTQHAAQLPSCLKCHGAGSILNDVTGTTGASTGLELANGAEAHATVFTNTQAIDDDIMCIGCHTYAAKTGAVTYSFSPGVDVGSLHIGS